MSVIHDDSFQITLPSNSSMSYYPENRANAYKTKLIRALDMSTAEWDVALIDVQFPQNWPNVLDETSLVFIIQYSPSVLANREAQLATRDHGKTDVGPSNGSDGHDTEFDLDADPFDWSWYEELTEKQCLSLRYVFAKRIIIPTGHYNSMEQIGNFIQEKFSNGVKSLNDYLLLGPVGEKPYFTGLPKIKLQFQYDNITGCARFIPSGPGVINFACKNPYVMQTIFGFAPSLERNQLISYELPISSTRHCSLEHISSMYIYSNIAKYQLVGDTEAPLLGIVPVRRLSSSIETNPGEQQYYSFSPPCYIPISKTASLDTIEIQINTDWGAPFPFANEGNSKVCCRLDFRKRRANHFFL